MFGGTGAGAVSDRSVLQNMFYNSDELYCLKLELPRNLLYNEFVKAMPHKSQEV